MTTRSTGTLTANTVVGSGMLVPFVKATWHLLTIYHGVNGGMNMTNAEALTEATEAVNHLKTMKIPTELMTDHSVEVLRTWIKSVENRQSTIKETQTKHDAEKPVSGSTLNVKDLITNSFEIFARMDLELAGIEAQNVDPGTAR